MLILYLSYTEHEGSSRSKGTAPWMTRLAWPGLAIQRFQSPVALASETWKAEENPPDAVTAVLARAIRTGSESAELKAALSRFGPHQVCRCDTLGRSSVHRARRDLLCTVVR